MTQSTPDLNAEIGKYNTLSIIALNDSGTYLDGGTLGEILLPRRFKPVDCVIKLPSIKNG